MNPTKLAAAVMLVSIMINAGLQCNREHLVAALKDYGLLGRALLANFVIVPLIGTILVRFFHLDTYVAIGFLLMAIAPGAPFLPRAAGRQPGGSLGFAIALAFILPALSIVTIPITTSFIFPPDSRATVPPSQFIVTLGVFQLLPLLVGLLIADRAPAIAAKLQRPFVLLFFATIAVLLVMLGPTIVKAVASVYGSHGMWAMLTIVLLSLGTGWLLGGRDVEYRRTLSIGTALRNIGFCVVIATTNFTGTLVEATVLTYFLIQFVVSLAFRVYLHRTSSGPLQPVGHA